ncbi:hypothetical protein CGMCC3_g4491 [Colletotrichum fructicola]|uniref:Citrate synthase n=2 Tax=Colletotrichum fructicola (strain Nara gc5) TaxID=1213859 RepID=L2GD93_COLFN|nr:uncharacterized protein CGMCC3_g4491 [Colletotrichum fructicola]KAE9579239.1 hypothetical protein CGMCC3_g4491 [Colletotrichum fructicola]KAF4902656.1 Citrate synthase [Colletotrichum fructicola]
MASRTLTICLLSYLLQILGIAFRMGKNISGYLDFAWYVGRVITTMVFLCVRQVAMQSLSVATAGLHILSRLGNNTWTLLQLPGHFLQPITDISSGTLTVRDNRTDLQYLIPITQNAIDAVDVGRIVDPSHQSQSGLRVFDPGYLNTACIKSNITFIDGQRGYIQYRQFSIEYLFENHDYEEVIYLLIWGKLPDKPEKEHFQRKLAASCVPPEHVVQTIASFSRDSSTSTMMIAGIAAYASQDEGAISIMGSARPAYLGRAGQVDAAIIRCMSALATVVALVYCHKRGKDLTPAHPSDSFVANVVRMMGFRDKRSSVLPDVGIQRCLEKLWILYADHGMTNSTAAFLHAASTLTDPLSCCISAIVSGYGPLHGGAIDLAYKTFEKIKTPNEVYSLITAVKTNKQRLYGYGHRIYKTVDPRVKLIHRMIDQHRDKVESNPMLAVALEIDRVANDDEYFTSRNLKANADLYGCFLYTAMGFETDIIVAMASLSRAAGVLAHWREAMLERGPALWRPKQIFTGKVLSPTVKT